jgi:electron transfer flavoprotein alpha subunit
MPGDVLIYVEHEGGRPRRVALEQATKARQLAEALGGKVLAVVLGADAASAAESLGRHGVDDVYVNEAPVFDEYLSAPHAEVLAQVFEETGPQVLLFPFTADGKDVASRVSARLSAGMVANVVDLLPDNGKVEANETVFGGNYTTTVDVKNSPVALFLVRPNAFAIEENARTAQTHTIEYTPSETAARARRGQAVQEEGAPTPLEEASTIVSGGRGLGGPEPFSLLEDLAGAIGGVVGASRAAVDAGWISYAHQVGQTGRTVKPQLYFAIGISGAVQHRVGMQTADTIVAINRDGDAPIFQLADLGVVGDLFAIVPALTAEIKRRKGA